MERFASFLGLLVMMLLAWLLSANRSKMNARLIISGVVLQLFFAVIILMTAPGKAFFEAARVVVAQILSFSDEGALFVFGESFRDHLVAFSVLSTIIFVSALTAVLFHLGIVQVIVKWMAKLMVKVMDTSGAESLAAVSNVFFGMTEAPLVIKPYLDSMTRSELMVMMCSGMATVSGGMMAVYAGMGIDAGHLLAASIMSAPASMVLAKIMVPEEQHSLTKGEVRIEVEDVDANILDAACRGAADGLRLALNVGAMLIAFIALVAMFNWVIGFLPDVAGQPLTLQRLLGWVCSPLAWLMGIPWSEATTVGQLLGERTILNEFYAYMDLAKVKDTLSPRSVHITTYALCGFANFGSIAVQIGGISSLAPSRRADFASLGFKAMIGGVLSTFMTACIAGMLI